MTESEQLAYLLQWLKYNGLAPQLYDKIVRLEKELQKRIENDN